MKISFSFFILFIATIFFGCEKDDTKNEELKLLQVFIGSTEIELSGVTDDLPVDRSITLQFSSPLNQNTAISAISLFTGEQPIQVNLSFSDDRTVVLRPVGSLDNFSTYVIKISGELESTNGFGFPGMEITFKTIAGELSITTVQVGEEEVPATGRIVNVPLNLSMTIHFSAPINKASFDDAFALEGPGVSGLQFTYTNEDQTVDITAPVPLDYLQRYDLEISNALEAANGGGFSGYSRILYTTVDETPKFPEIPDEELLTKIQEQTFKYFWDFAHPVSGLARERNTSGETVTSGGSGFGVMSIIVGIERGFITRQQGIDRLEKIIDFLKDDADRFHGAWSHWLNGTTGNVIPFSANDNGGDLVETAFMVQGLLTVRQYLDPDNLQEAAMIEKINVLWEAVEWDWYTQDGQNVLYWHWSPQFEWQMNHKIQGWNEALIVYVLAASSQNHSIAPEVYHEGWAGNGSMENTNNNTYYGYTLPLRNDRGGPLFFAHYSFLGLDPRNLSDQYADYWIQNRTHTLLNRAYSIANPKDYVNYTENSWGLTASDGNMGYSAHSPDNDRGVITPTAAISSIPYTPEESMAAIRHFYYILGDRLWGEYGFYDSFNITAGWTADSFLAIDQGPIVVMIENHRTGLLWDLFMSAPEVQNGLDKLGFTYE